MVDVALADHTIHGLETILSQVQAQKTGERSEEQRKIAILVTKIEDCVAWAKYAYENVE